MKEQQTAPLTTEELTEKYHKLRRTFILATVISIFGTIVMLPSVLFFKVPYALAGALVLLTGESMRYRIKKEMRALAPWILASGVLNETFEDVRYQPSGCLSRETLLESGLPLPEFDAVQGSALVSAAYQGTSFELSNIRLSDPAKGAEPVFQGYCLRCRLGFPLPAELSSEASEDALELLPDGGDSAAAGSASCWAATIPARCRRKKRAPAHQWSPPAGTRTSRAAQRAVRHAAAKSGSPAERKTAICRSPLRSSP